MPFLLGFWKRGLDPVANSLPAGLTRRALSNLSLCLFTKLDILLARRHDAFYSCHGQMDCVLA